MVANLTKQVGFQLKQVCSHLYSLLCVCAGHLTLTRPLLETLIVDIVKKGWEEVGREGQGEERQDRRDRKTKGRKGLSCQGREVQSKRQGQGWRSGCEVKAAGQKEEEWQEVGALFGLVFQMDSGLVSPSQLYEFLDSYGLDWALLNGDCRFLCMTYPDLVTLMEQDLAFMVLS